MSEETQEIQVEEGDLEQEQPQEDAELETAPVGQEDESVPEEPEKKSRLQARIDELVRQREEAKEEAAAWRGESQRLLRDSQKPELPKIEIDMSDYPVPRRDNFEDEDEYQSALAERASVKAYRTMKAQDQQESQIRQRHEAQTQLMAWQNAGRSKYADFDLALNNNVTITDNMAQTIMTNEYGHDVAYFLGKNPEEARRIASLHPLDQKMEILKLANKESKRKKPKTETTAPSVTSPVGDREPIAKKKWNLYDPDIPFKEYERLRMEGTVS